MPKRPRRILRRRWATSEGWRATPAGMWACLAQRAKFLASASNAVERCGLRGVNCELVDADNPVAYFPFEQGDQIASCGDQLGTAAACRFHLFGSHRLHCATTCVHEFQAKRTKLLWRFAKSPQRYISAFGLDDLQKGGFGCFSVSIHAT